MYIVCKFYTFYLLEIFQFLPVGNILICVKIYRYIGLFYCGNKIIAYYYYDYYDYDYYCYCCASFKLSLCLQVRIVVKPRITIIWVNSCHFSNRMMLHLRLWKAFTISQLCAITHFWHFLITFILSESPTLYNLWIRSLWYPNRKSNTKLTWITL